MPIETAPHPTRGHKVCNAPRSAKENRDKLCTLPAGWGTDHPGYGRCKFHLGTAPAQMVVAAREEAYAKVEQLKRLGRFKEGATAEEVLLQEISRSAGAVAVLDDMVSELDEDAMLTLRGQTLIDTWNEQRRLLVQVGKTVLQAGVAERQVQIAEMQANALVACLLAVIGAPEMALSAEQQSMARRLMATQLRELPVAQVAS